MANASSSNTQTQNYEMSEYPQHDHFGQYYCIVFGVFPNFISIWLQDDENIVETYGLASFTLLGKIKKRDRLWFPTIQNVPFSLALSTFEACIKE